MRVVFFGTPAFAVPILEALAAEVEVALVVTQPDQPSGRGRKLTAPPVKSAALRLGLSVLQPTSIKGSPFAESIAALAPDFMVTAAYGRIFGRRLLEVPKRACLNIHASLLPKYRGAAPANWAILSGDPISGVSIMAMAPGLDEGPVYLSCPLRIGDEETAGELLDRLSLVGAQAVTEVINGFSQCAPIPQNDALATWAPILQKSDGLIDWHQPASSIANKIRGLDPWPAAHAKLGNLSLKLYRAQLLHTSGCLGTPGEVVAITPEGIHLACGDGLVCVREIQAAGKNRMNAALFAQGARLELGAKLG